LVSGIYVWANYLRLEHYLLVPWLLIGIGAGVALEAIVERVPGWRIGVAALAVLFAVALGISTARVADLSGDRSGDAYVSSVMESLPRDAVILSEWDTSTPLWYGQLIAGDRPDVLVLDDSNIVYDGWGTRERAIAAFVCQRPVFMLRLDEADLASTRDAYVLLPFMEVHVAIGGPTAVADRTIYRVAAPASCSS
jgi:hypothetical protein